MLTRKPRARRLRRVARMAGAIVLIAALFVATLNNEALYAVLGQVWRQAFFGVGLSPRDSAAMVSQVSGQVTNTARDAPAVLIYGALYVGTCLALLWLVLPAASQRRLALTFYGGATLLFVVLLGAGQLGSSVLLQLSSQLIHFIVSPLPVIGLVPLLRWYLPHKQPF